MVSGSSKNNFDESLSLFKDQPALFTSLLDKLSIYIALHLFYQALSGCQILQIFDSHFSKLDDVPELQAIVFDLNVKIVANTKKLLSDYGLNIKFVFFKFTTIRNFYIFLVVLKKIKYICFMHPSFIIERKFYLTKNNNVFIYFLCYTNWLNRNLFNLKNYWNLKTRRSYMNIFTFFCYLGCSFPIENLYSGL